MKAHDAGADVPPPPGKAPFPARRPRRTRPARLGRLRPLASGTWRRPATRWSGLRTLAVPQVRTVVAARAEGPLDLVLPGEMQAFTTAAIAARATGYIAERRVDSRITGQGRRPSPAHRRTRISTSDSPRPRRRSAS
ncbi:hypothetical protein ACU4GA_02065 [Methylobacterium oryzae CBMB20]